MEGRLFALPDAEGESRGEEGVGRPRLKRANRAQIRLEPMDLESSLPEEHPARLIWAFVEELDLGPLYAEIRAVEGHPGQNAIDPKILMALWFYATLEGVGSARALDRLCQEHDAYRWLCGGVSVNYHTLADFRVRHGEVLDGLLTRGVAALLAEGLVSLDRTAQDGMRVRASAGRSSFRERRSLERCLQEAEGHVEALRRELETDPAAASRRQATARERARRERAARVREALKHLESMEEQRRKSHKKANKLKAVKASITDPEARLMRMADGGFRPAYNAQVAVDTATRLIVAVEATDQVDQGQMAPMVGQIEQRYGRAPSEHLVDGSFVTLQDLETVSPPEGGTMVYAPLPEETAKAKPFRTVQAPAVKAWRERMDTPEGQAIYRQRASTVEWAQAMMRNRGLEQLPVRGLQKVKAILLWFALLHNLLLGHALRLHAQARGLVGMGQA